MSDHVLISRDGPVMTITLNRPEKFNALTFEMYARIGDTCRNVPADGSVRAVVITGAGTKAFAAGTDISLFRDFKTEADGINYEKGGDACFSGIEACPVPTIAAIAGACTGGGAGIVACCDMRIATRDMKYGFPIARTLGNVLSAATLARLVARLGEAKVIEMIYTSRLIEADEALRIGFVSELCDDHAALMRRTQELAAQIAGNAPLTLRATKKLLRRLRKAATPRVDDDDIVGMIYTSADFHEGLEAFLAKRKANWTGR
jgi:enoyl-CoA hydratase/carnithine racemase